MASFNFIGIEKLLEGIDMEVERIDRNGPDAIMAGADVAIAAMKTTVPVGKTRGLKNSISANEVKHSVENGYYTDVYPHDENEKGVRYADIGFILEYGRSNMLPYPWMRTAVEKNADAIANAVFDTLMRD